MLRNKILPLLAFLCAFSIVGTSQTQTPVRHPFRHNRPGPGQIFGNLNLAGSPDADQAVQEFKGGIYRVGPQVEATNTPYEAEEEIAVDPLNPRFVLAAISDFSLDRYGLIGTNQTKYAWSNDGGSTWKQQFTPYDESAGDPLTSDGLVWSEMSDPVVAIDSMRNIAYLSDLYFSDFNGSNGYYISSSPVQNGSVTFTAAQTRPVAVNADPNAQTFEDKPWIAVDNTLESGTSGNLYAAWVHYLAPQYFPAGGEIHVVRSTDHGATFSSAVVVSPPTQVNNVQGPQIAVDSRGRVVVSWLYCLNYVPIPGQFNDKCLQSQIWGAVSSDAGKTFSKPVQISPTNNDLDGSGFPSQYRKWSAPAMAVDPRTGAIAVLFADQIGANSAIEYVHCPPAFSGPCSQPVQVNDVSYGQRVFPAIAIDNLGIVSMSWYDSRNDPSDPYSSQLDIYATYAWSIDSPLHPNARVTPTTMDLSNAGPYPGFGFIGDYSGIAASWGIARPAWTNGVLTTSTLSPSLF